jgi:hypothetical protein
MASPDRNGNRQVRGLTVSVYLAALGFLLIPILGAFDLVTGTDFSFSLFYLIPVVLVTWYAGGRLGAMASVLSAAAWLEAEFRGGHVFSHDLFAWWSAAVRFGFFIVVAVLLTRLHTALDREKDFARKDPLTGMANRRYFLRRADLEIYRARRYGRPLTVAYIDLHGLVDDGRGPHAHGLVPQPGVPECRDENEGHGGPQAAYSGQHLQPAPAGHTVVGDDHVGSALDVGHADGESHEIDELASVRGLDHVVSLLLEHLGQQGPHLVVVLGEENAHSILPAQRLFGCCVIPAAGRNVFDRSQGFSPNKCFLCPFPVPNYAIPVPRT